MATALALLWELVLGHIDGDISIAAKMQRDKTDLGQSQSQAVTGKSVATGDSCPPAASPPKGSTTSNSATCWDQVYRHVSVCGRHFIFKPE